MVNEPGFSLSGKGLANVNATTELSCAREPKAPTAASWTWGPISTEPRQLYDRWGTFASLLWSKVDNLFATHPPPCLVLRSIRFGLSQPRFPLVSLARSACGSHSVTLVRYICVQRVDESINAIDITICGDLSSSRGR